MNLKQSRLGSLGEQTVNTLSGFGLSLFLQWLYFDVYLGLPLHPLQNLVFAIGMTFVSIGRGYWIRRLSERFGLRAKLSPAMQAVVAERLRQKTSEGFDEDHDDRHVPGELGLAGAAYLMTAHPRSATSIQPEEIFPWVNDWWKPTDIRRNLVKGCALGLAELERFDRMRRRKGTKP